MEVRYAVLCTAQRSGGAIHHDPGIHHLASVSLPPQRRGCSDVRGAGSWHRVEILSSKARRQVPGEQRTARRAETGVAEKARVDCIVYVVYTD
jgi:CRISPR/Cas system type I-B associated protein Csh2 (Cas7 group RAMP superfamily)